jgi:2-(1,2-epoxy-1,2-dihydrophenyl)acetyl-CoA isomerase
VDSTVTYEVRDRVAYVTLNRPDGGNAMNLQLGRDLFDAARRCEADRSVRAVVLTGAGKSFCFGGDLRGMLVESGDNLGGYLRELTADLHDAILRFTHMDAPVIAAVNGTAAGAGIGLVAMADLTVAAEGAKFSLAYTGVGLTPDGSTSWFLPRAVGYKRAMELMLTNRVLTAAEALNWGLVNQVVPNGEALNEATKLALRLAAGPRNAFGRAKRLMGSSMDLAQQLDDESRAIAAQGPSPEGREGIQAFLEKRPPRYE